MGRREPPGSGSSAGGSAAGFGVRRDAASLSQGRGSVWIDTVAEQGEEQQNLLNNTLQATDGKAFSLFSDHCLYPLIACCLGTVLWVAYLLFDIYALRDSQKQADLPSLVSVSYSFCGIAYACNLLLNLLKSVCEASPVKIKLHILASYISLLSSGTYMLLWMDVLCVQENINSVLWIPARWVLYMWTMPVIWWIIGHISCYTLKQRLYLLVLNTVMIFAGGIATLPGLPWVTQVFFVALSCVPFPELCFHLWHMLTDALDATLVPNKNDDQMYHNVEITASIAALRFIRVFGVLSYQAFPCIYFAAFEGLLPLTISEPTWSLCDWALKMVMTDSLMEANFFTIQEHHEAALRSIEDRHRIATIRDLSALIKRKDDFLSAMSHELRTPLNGIIGLTDALLAKPGDELNASVSKTLSMIRLSGKRFLHLINDILDAAKLKNGQLIIKHENVNIDSLVNDVMHLTIPLVPAMVALNSYVAENMPIIAGDSERIIQILYNLLGNACKFTSSGEISIAGTVDPDGKHVRIAVSDTGIGIAPDKINHVFQPFEQGDMSATRSFGGTGLGLHLVKELVKAHHGEISVESVLGKGSCFTCILPVRQPGGGGNQLAPGMAVSEPPAISEEHLKKTFHRFQNGGQTPLILCVEDEPVNQMVVSNLVGNEYMLEFADTGQAAIDWLEEAEVMPDVVILDYILPDMTGDQVHDAIIANHKDKFIPVVLASAESRQFSTNKPATPQHHIGFLQKPFTSKALMSSIQDALARTNLAADKGAKDGKPAMRSTDGDASSNKAGGSSNKAEGDKASGAVAQTHVSKHVGARVRHAVTEPQTRPPQEEETPKDVTAEEIALRKHLLASCSTTGGVDTIITCGNGLGVLAQKSMIVAVDASMINAKSDELGSHTVFSMLKMLHDDLKSIVNEIPGVVLKALNTTFLILISCEQLPHNQTQGMQQSSREYSTQPHTQLMTVTSKLEVLLKQIGDLMQEFPEKAQQMVTTRIEHPLELTCVIDCGEVRIAGMTGHTANILELLLSEPIMRVLQLLSQVVPGSIVLIGMTRTLLPGIRAIPESETSLKLLQDRTVHVVDFRNGAQTAKILRAIHDLDSASDCNSSLTNRTNHSRTSGNSPRTNSLSTLAEEYSKSGGEGGGRGYFKQPKTALEWAVMTKVNMLKSLERKLAKSRNRLRELNSELALHERTTDHAQSNTSQASSLTRSTRGSIFKPSTPLEYQPDLTLLSLNPTENLAIASPSLEQTTAATAKEGGAPKEEKDDIPKEEKDDMLMGLNSVLVSIPDRSTFLADLQLSHLDAILAEQQISPLMLAQLDAPALESIGITDGGERMKLREAAQKLQSKISEMLADTHRLHITSIQQKEEEADCS